MVACVCQAETRFRLLFVAGVLGIFLPPLWIGAKPSQAAPLVVRVVDGDTVDVQVDGNRTERVRLIGIDTPEVVDPRRPFSAFAERLSATRNELLDGQSIGAEPDPSRRERDMYGRLLAYVWLPDGRNFGEVMIADSYVHDYTLGSALCVSRIATLSGLRRTPRW
jgi:endonuclease YncB( thermonuclease family)